jgi:hypothetical protein
LLGGGLVLAVALVPARHVIAAASKVAVIGSGIIGGYGSGGGFEWLSTSAKGGGGGGGGNANGDITALE